MDPAKVRRELAPYLERPPPPNAFGPLGTVLRDADFVIEELVNDRLVVAVFLDWLTEEIQKDMLDPSYPRWTAFHAELLRRLPDVRKASGG